MLAESSFDKKPIPWHLACLAFLLLVGLALFFWRLGERDLWSSHEARAAMNASSLLQADSDGLPRLFDGRAETQKPPLYYWAAACIGWLRGDADEWAVRLPAALSALTVVLLVVAAAAKMGQPLAGLLAALVLVSGIHFPWLARIARIDMPLTLTTAAAALAFFFSRIHSRIAWLTIAWLACAAGVLLKGPIGLALPAAIVVAWLLLDGRWPAFWEWSQWRRTFAEFGVWWGVPLMLFACAPIFMWLEIRSEGAFARDFFWLHNLQRGLGGSRLRGHAWWLYVPYLFLYLLPFSPLLIAVAWRRLWRDDPLARFSLAWLVGVVVLLSAARFKRADYLLPAYPAAALFLGCILARHRLAVIGVACVSAVMLAGWAVRIGYLLPEEERYRDYRPFAALVRRHAPVPEKVIFFRGEAHALMFRVSRPLGVLVEWSELRGCIEQNRTVHVVMPVRFVGEIARELPGMVVERLGETGDSKEQHERPLVLLRMRASSKPATETAHDHARTPRTAADR